MRLIVKGAYSGRVIETLDMESIDNVRDYVFDQYNACWSIERDLKSNDIIALVYEN